VFDARLRIYKRIRNNTDRVLMWDLSSSYIGNEPKWIEGQDKYYKMKRGKYKQYNHSTS
jgi:hypothetical protein